MNIFSKITILIYLLVATNSYGQWFWGNTNGKDSAQNLTNQIAHQNDSKTIEVGTVDPSAVATNASDGSMFIGTGAIYQKQDAGLSTNWLPLLIGPAGSGTDECVSRWDGTGVPYLQNSIFCITDLGVATGLIQIDVGNMSISANAIVSTDLNGDITLNPNGTGKVVIDSDLDVLGTITNFSQTSLVVTNATITVNDGGNQATADSNDAGLIVEMSDATDAQMGYDSTATSKWIAGEVGSLAEVATISHTQTLTNKSIDADSNTITNIENADIKAAAAITRSKLASGTINHVLINDGAGAMSSEATLATSRGGTNLSTVPTNGQLLIGNGTDYTLAGLTGTANQIVLTPGAGSITLSTPQDIHTGANPTFVGATLSGLAINSIVQTNGTSVLTTGAVNLASQVSGILPNSNGGTGQDSSAFTGVAKIAAGVWSASLLVDADVSATANITATKLGTGLVDNTEFNLLNGRTYIPDAVGVDNQVAIFDGVNSMDSTANFTNNDGVVGITGNLTVDNLDLNGNSLISTNINGDVLIDPNGTGKTGINEGTPSTELDVAGAISSSGVGVDADNFLEDGGLEDGIQFTCTEPDTCAIETGAGNKLGGKQSLVMSDTGTAIYDAEYCITDAGLADMELQVSCFVKSASPEINLCGSDDSGSGDICLDYDGSDKFRNIILPSKVASGAGKICARVTSDSAIATAVYVDKCKITARPKHTLSNDTDWVTFTPSWDNIATTTTLAQAIWRRRGENMEIIVIIDSGANDGVASSLKMAIPDSKVINPTVIGSSGLAEPWSGIETFWNDGGASLNNLDSRVDTTNNKLVWSKANGTGFDGVDFNSTDTLKIHASIPIANWSTASNIITQNSDFLIDANIGGANPTMGATSVATYQGIEDASLDLVKNSLSSPVGIACSGANENNVGDLTCSVGNESVGIVFNYSGKVRACVSFSNREDTDAAGFAIPVFQVRMTENNSQTKLQDGNEKISQATKTTALTSANSGKICGVFKTTGKTTLRLVYELAANAVVNNNELLADRDASSGDRDIHWSVIPVSSVIVGEFSPKKTQQKCLSANAAATGVMADLTFSNLTIGDWYQISGNIIANSNDVTNNTKQIIVQAKDGATILRAFEDRVADATLRDVTFTPNIKYKTVTSSLTFDFSTRLRMNIGGDGTTSKTCIELEEVNIDTTTDW